MLNLKSLIISVFILALLHSNKASQDYYPGMCFEAPVTIDQGIISEDLRDAQIKSGVEFDTGDSREAIYISYGGQIQSQNVVLDSPFSISFWFRVDLQNSDERFPIMSFTDSKADGNHYALLIDFSQGYIGLFKEVEKNSVTQEFLVEQTDIYVESLEWYHLTLLSSSEFPYPLLFYVNGQYAYRVDQEYTYVLKQHSFDYMTFGKSEWICGSETGCDYKADGSMIQQGEHFQYQGYIESFRMYDRLLSREEISCLSNHDNSHQCGGQCNVDLQNVTVEGDLNINLSCNNSIVLCGNLYGDSSNFLIPKEAKHVTIRDYNARDTIDFRNLNCIRDATDLTFTSKLGQSSEISVDPLGIVILVEDFLPNEIDPIYYIFGDSNAECGQSGQSGQNEDYSSSLVLIYQVSLMALVFLVDVFLI